MRGEGHSPCNNLGPGPLIWNYVGKSQGESHKTKCIVLGCTLTPSIYSSIIAIGEVNRVDLGGRLRK